MTGGLRSRSWPPHGKGLWLLAAAAVAAGTVFAALVAVRAARRTRASFHPPRERVDPAAARRALGAFEEVSFTAADGVRLRGWYVPARNRAAVVLAHGYGASRAQMVPQARALVERGYGVLLFDWRGHGESGEARVTQGVAERADLEAAVSFVSARPDVDPRRLGLVGFSMGAMVAVDQAARDPRVRAVVAEAPFTSLREEVEHDERRHWLGQKAALLVFRRAGVDLEAASPVRHAGALAPRPLVLVAGADDEVVPPEVVRRVYAAAGAPKELWVLPGTSHHGIVEARDGALARRVVSFFDRALP